ncbi:unnamed protein product [Moneuplotes crassus]|uniref:Protein artemis n=2 Tax=Euplotes crassus TaxID=5936 RepID=A0AAD1XB81_EUPCR|nr:unnamed protein product [Moneuplotes crassus]
MSLIPGTNILVDKFSQGNNDVNSYVYFLSHFHTDHYSELHDSWDLGIIYAYNPTRTLLVDLYPNLETRCVGLECNQKYQIFLDKEQTETVQVTLFDSNHCPGSVMMLFEGRMGRVIHTGDFRFTEEFFTFKQLFPPELDNEEKFKCSIEIDHLIMDATFADPIKDHPQKQEAYDGICKIIRRHKKFRVYLFVYLLGKEEVFASLAKEFKTKVIVDEERYRKIQLLDLEPELYSTNPDDGWIHIKTKEERKGMDIEKYNEECPTIFITMSARSNEDSSSKRFIYKSYYSSHSNARELEQFMKAIFPKKITYHSHPDYTDSRRFRSYLTRTYTEEGQEVELSRLQPWRNSDTIKRPTRKYEKCMIDRFDEEVKMKMNKRAFIKQNPFMEKRRKRHNKSGAKLVHSQPILTLSDDSDTENTLKVNLIEENKDIETATERHLQRGTSRFKEVRKAQEERSQNDPESYCNHRMQGRII